MKLIVGLGNEGDRFKNTRHNVGWRVIDELIRQESLPACTNNDKFEAMIAEANLAGEKLLLVKPITMMNLSGKAVGKLVNFYKLDPTDVWVIHDEVDLEFGKLRVRRGGSSAGHNGVKSLIEALGENFGRFRFGVRNNEFATHPTDSFVLSAFNKEENEQLPSMILKAAEQVLEHLKSGELVDTTYDLSGPK